MIPSTFGTEPPSNESPHRLTPPSSHRDLPILTENLEEHLFLSQAQKTNEVLQLLPKENLPVPPKYKVQTATPPTPPAPPQPGRLDELLLRRGGAAELCVQLALLAAGDAENYGQPVSLQCQLGNAYGQVFSPNAVLRHLTSHLVGPDGFWDPSPAGNIEEITVETGTRLLVIGDTHGQLNDVLWIFLKYGMPSATNRYLFDGDIADRGGHALEIILLLFAFKRDCNSSVYILRGNHEDYSMNGGGFEDELKHKFALLNYGKIWQACHLTIWPLLPVAATIVSASQARRFFVVHGGLPVEVPGFNGRPVSIEDDIGTLDRKRPSVVYPYRNEDDPVSMLLFHLLWADPEETSGAMRGNPFNEQQTLEFCEANYIDCLIRAHNPPSNWQGAEWHHQNRCITIFSASNYCGRMLNRGGVLICEGELFPVLKEHTAPGYARLAQLLPAHLNTGRDQRQQVVADWEGSVPSGPLGQPFRDLDDGTVTVQIEPAATSDSEDEAECSAVLDKPTATDETAAVDVSSTASAPVALPSPSQASTALPVSPVSPTSPVEAVPNSNPTSPPVSPTVTSTSLATPATSNPATVSSTVVFAPPARGLAATTARATSSSGLPARTCLSRHPLTRFLTVHPIVKCDGCQLKWGQGSTMYGCRICNYDLCPQCNLTGTSTFLFQPGQPVECLYQNGHWYSAVVAEHLPDGNYLVNWNDGAAEDRSKNSDQIRVKSIAQTCPQKHRLVGFANGHIIKFECDKCQKCSPSGAVMYGCRRCDYDLCQDCLSEAVPDSPTTEASSTSPAVSEVWAGLARFLEEQMISHKQDLFEAFISRDSTLGGKVSKEEWIEVMLEVLGPAVNKPGNIPVLTVERLGPCIKVWNLTEPIAYARFLHRFQVQGSFASWDMLETCSTLMRRLSETSHFELSTLLDRNADGTFSYDEFHSFLSTFFENVPKWQAATLYEAMVQVQGRRPSVGDHLRLDDAILCLALTSRDAPEDNHIAQEGTDRVGRAIDSSGQSYAAFFRAWDTDNSGYLSLQQLEAGLQDIAQNPIDPNMLTGFNARLSIFNFVRAVAPRSLVIKIQRSMVRELLTGVWLHKERLRGLFGLYDPKCTGKVTSAVFKACIDAVDEFEQQEGRHSLLSTIQKAAVVEVATQGAESIEYGPFFEELRIVDKDTV